MNVEDPQVLKDLVDQAARNFGGILHAELDLALTRLEAMVTRAEVLVARMEGATLTGMVGFQFGPPAPMSVDPGAPK
jgi:hypothetical protein